MTTTKKTLLATALLAALGASTQANALLFDPDGSGSEGAINVGSFDWTTSSFVAVGGNQAVANFISGSGSTQFSVLTHATLVGTLSPNNAPNTPSGLGVDYEITMILKFTEEVTDVGHLGSQNIATFSAVPVGASFLEIFYDTSINANALTGSGFNDGRLILSGHELDNAAEGSFNVVAPGRPPVATVVDLDQSSNGNQYTGQKTVTGQGSTGAFAVDHLTTDSTFFLQQLATFGISFANISQALPYISVDPSDCFTSAASGAAVGTTVGLSGCNAHHDDTTYALQTTPPGAGGYVPVVGTVNGAFFTVGTAGGPDFVAQTDFNSPLVAKVPEPASITLLGFGLGALGMVSRRRRLI